MKIILTFACAFTLLTATGCLVAEGRHYESGHGKHHGHGEVFVPAPVIIVPVVRVHGD